MNPEEDASRIDRLLDAVELLKANRRAEARALLRQLIHENNDFEDAWLWMSVAVDSLDESAVCLDNVLRINAHNTGAAESLVRIRAPELAMEQQREQLRFYRDLALGSMWVLILAILFGGFFTLFGLAR